VARDRPVPLALLASFGLAFGAAALGATPLAFDDHPGQLYRLWHVVTRGPAPWAWNPDWWAGYPELQFYPPGAAYVGALLHLASFTALSVPASYHALVWIAYLAPGLTAFLALARILGSGWRALPGAFLALTVSAGAASGVEGGIHIGMVGARLAWALVPLLVLALVPWLEEHRRIPRSAVLATAAIVLLHPAMLPAAVMLILVAAVARPPRVRRLAAALAALALAAALTAFWTGPLLLRLANARALAWGEPPSIGRLGWLLVILALVGFCRARGPAARVVARLPWAMLGIVLLDRVALEPLGARFLPANRVADGALIALILAAALGWSGLRRAANGGTPRREILVSLVGMLLLVVVGLRSGALSLWPRAADWPTLAVVERGLRLSDLWAALREAPPGRVLFMRSGVPLVYGPPWGTAWYRPHTHITALAPLFSGRAIVGGTFTHPSPIAALLYRGDAGPGPITQLAEQLDGHSLFGRPLESLAPETLNGYAAALGIGAVVALDEDASRLRALDDNRDFTRRLAPSPFLIFGRRDGVDLPRAADGDRWTITLTAARDGWVSARTTYYPLWHASAGGVPLATRRGQLGDLEVRLAGVGPRVVDLVYRPGMAETSGIVISGLGGVVWLAACRRSRAA
jgi:hypothetical protein